MKRLQTKPRLHHTVVFSALGSMSDEQALLALTSLGVPLPAAGDKRAGQPGGSWLACGLRSDGVVELWRATAGGELPGALVAAAIPYCLCDCTVRG